MKSHTNMKIFLGNFWECLWISKHNTGNIKTIQGAISIANHSCSKNLKGRTKKTGKKKKKNQTSSKCLWFNLLQQKAWKQCCPIFSSQLRKLGLTRTQVWFPAAVTRVTCDGSTRGAHRTRHLWHQPRSPQEPSLMDTLPGRTQISLTEKARKKTPEKRTSWFSSKEASVSHRLSTNS